MSSGINITTIRYYSSHSSSKTYICFVAEKEKLTSLIIWFDYFEYFDVRTPPRVNASDLAADTIDAIGEMTETAARTHNAYIPHAPGEKYSNLQFQHGDAAIYLEGFPCTGTTEIRLPEVEDPIEQFRYSDVASGLKGYVEVASNKRTADQNAGMAFVIELKRGIGHLATFDYLGWFTVQSSRAKYFKFSELVQNVYFCDGGTQSVGTASTAKSDTSSIAQIASPSVASL